jgi:hypothetical protein
MWKTQSATSFIHYLNFMNDFLDKFGSKYWQYVASIHLVNWTVFGNAEDIFENQAYQDFIDNNVMDFYEGQPRSLYGFCINNFVESNNNVDLNNNIWQSSPYDSQFKWMYKQANALTKRSINSYNWMKNGYWLTPCAQNVSKKESENSGFYISTGSRFVDGSYNECIVQRIGVTSNTIRCVDLKGKKCNCLLSQQHKFVCSHVISAIKTLKLEE